MKKQAVAPRTLHEWLDRNGMSAAALCERIKKETGCAISPAMMSFILRGSRRCSHWNAMHIHAVTNVPVEELTRWPRASESDKDSGEGQSHVA